MNENVNKPDAEKTAGTLILTAAHTWYDTPCYVATDLAMIRMLMAGASAQSVGRAADFSNGSVCQSAVWPPTLHPLPESQKRHPLEPQILALENEALLLCFSPHHCGPKAQSPSLAQRFDVHGITHNCPISHHPFAFIRW